MAELRTIFSGTTLHPASFACTEATSEFSARLESARQALEWCRGPECIAYRSGQKDKTDVNLPRLRGPQIPEKQGMRLHRFDDWIDEVSEKHGEDKNQKNATVSSTSWSGGRGMTFSFDVV
jgi:hypothetical protein